jgi:hypothetical protein
VVGVAEEPDVFEAPGLCADREGVAEADPDLVHLVLVLADAEQQPRRGRLPGTDADDPAVVGIPGTVLRHDDLGDLDQREAPFPAASVARNRHTDTTVPSRVTWTRRLHIPTGM